MKILRTRQELKIWRQAMADQPIAQGHQAKTQDNQLRAQVGFVPTMGAIHEGHLSLVQASKHSCDHTLVSIFVNPTQFGPKEDLNQYPRPFEKDVELLKNEGVDALFVPDASEVYENNFSTFIIEESVSKPLCGALRPDHFRGVTTIVLKLFNLAQPQLVFFGQKDAQQCAVIERMVRDLDIPLQIIRCPTVRETDGLALSSRNTYLTPLEREKAPLIYKSLCACAAAFQNGERSVEKILGAGKSILEADPNFKIQYYEIRHPQTLAPLQAITQDGALIAVAAYLGKTRLIDNLEIKNGS